MPDEIQSEAVDEFGPVDYLVIEFPEGRTTGKGLPLLLDLVDRGIIRVLDLVFIRHAHTGEVSFVTPRDLSADLVVDLTGFEGASSGLIGDDDLAAIGAVISQGSSAAVVVYENSWAAPLATALRRGGAQLVSSGRITVEQLAAALEESEPAASGVTS
jgi:hypothetical protein